MERRGAATVAPSLLFRRAGYAPVRQRVRSPTPESTMRTAPVRRVAWAACLLCALAGRAPAQAPPDPPAPPIEPGQRLRVLTAGQREVVGTLTEVRGDTLLLSPAGSSRMLPIPLDAVQRVELSLGFRFLGPERAGIGLLLGALAGGTVMAGVCAETYDCPVGLMTAAAGGLAGLVGAGIGWLSGRQSRRERWREITADVTSWIRSGGGPRSIAWRREGAGRWR